MRTLFRPSVAAATLVAAVSLLGLAGDTLAGGFHVGIGLDRDRYVADAAGRVTLEVELVFEGCIPYAMLAADPRQPGPLVGLEVRHGDAWVAMRGYRVASPWSVQNECQGGQAKGGEACSCGSRCRCGTCTGVGGSPKCSCDAAPAAPIRLEPGIKLAFERRAQLAPGTYRLVVEASHEELNGGKPIVFESEPFEVEALPAKNGPA